MKVGSSSLNLSTLLSGGQQHVPVVRAHPMAQLLFGKRPPKLLDKRRFPRVRRGLKKLEDMTEHVSLLLGRTEKDFELELCEGRNASISRDGQVAFGLDLLAEHQEDDDLLMGILGHELGHQPWDWPSGNFSGLTRAQLDQLYREEEAKADRFAGRVLAELGGTPGSVERFLMKHAGFEQKQSAEYYPADVRVKMISEAYDKRRRAMRRSTKHLTG